jgi:FAD/FMN-containing dehydrogenase
MGRSTGRASLSLWTHYQQRQEWFDNYSDPWSNYNGPAVKAHAGVLGTQLYEQADARGYHIVGGECPTVGFVGGYVQGGGHSVLSSYKGMAADHVLSFEVVTTSGKFMNVSNTEHPDLFWALRGGVSSHPLYINCG